MPVFIKHTGCLVLLLALAFAGCRQADVEAYEDEIRQQEEEIAELQQEIEELRELLRYREMILREQSRRIEPERRLPEDALALLQDGRTGLWGTDEQAMVFRFLREVDVEETGALVDTFNAVYSDDFHPGLDLLDTTGHLLRLRVRDPEQLANRMGSTGARVYLGTATLTMTSLPGIDSVYFDFGEDFDLDRATHAAPGAMTRLDVAAEVESGSLPR